MDEFKDFFKELKERATSPLFGSFAVAWCIRNWPIIIAILFNNSNELKNDRFFFIFSIIKVHANVVDMLVVPLCIAIIYTVLYPYVKGEIKLHIATESARTQSNILRDTGVNTVSLTKYIEMLEAHKESQDKLEKLFASQSTTLEEVQQLSNMLNDERIKSGNLQNDLNSLKSQASIIESNIQTANEIKDITHFKGVWIYRNLTSGFTAEVAIGTKEVKLPQYETLYKIVNLFVDVTERVLTFVLENQSEGTVGFTGMVERTLELRTLVLKYVDRNELVSPGGSREKYAMNKIGMNTMGLE